MFFRDKKDIEKIEALEVVVADLQATIAEKTKNIDSFINLLQEEKDKAERLKSKQFALKNVNKSKLYHYHELKLKIGEIQNRILDNYYKD
jgi:hypothetical protein